MSSNMNDPIPFIDLAAQRKRLGSAVDRAIDAVLAHGRYVLGPEVDELEAALAERTGVAHVISCANGTDALQLCLRALGVGPGDAVFVPAFTFSAPAEVVALVGATPVFVDVDSASFNMDADSLAAAVAAIGRQGQLHPAGVIPVDLFGQAADHIAIAQVAEREGLWAIEDAAQSFGATLDGKPCGSFGIAGTTSFFPAKPLGCYGDGGAIFTADEDIARTLRSLRMHGQGTDKNKNIAIGTNSRLDTLQAAILLEKLRIFDDELVARERIARRYSTALDPHVGVPAVAPAATSVWAQYTIRTPARDQVCQTLAAANIPNAIYYPHTLPQQPVYKEFPVVPGGARVAETLAREAVSLPMHPYLDTETQDRIISAVLQAVGGTEAGSA
jgi:dTDP-4-amino-4,6-dideoxygalactose transaminase